MIHAIVLALALGDAENAAVTNSPSVYEARARVAEQKALLDAARGLGVPHAIANYAAAPQFGTIGTVEQQLTTAGLQIAFGEVTGREPAIAQAQANLRSAYASELDAERVERIRVVGMYFDVLRTAEIRRLEGAIVSSLQADVHAAQLRYAAGDVPHLDVLRADVALARAQADFAAARANESNALHALATETGEDVQSLTTPTLSQLTQSLAPAVPPTDDAAIAIALQHRPEIAAARADVSSEEAAMRAAQRATLPGVIAQVGYTTGVDTAMHVSGPNANVTLDVPLSHAANDRVRAEQARLDQATARLELQQRTIAVEVGNTVRTYQAAVIASAAATRARVEAAQEVRATQTGYLAGASSSLDLEDARRAYAQAAVDEATALAARAQAAATLDALMGVQP